MRRFHLTSLLAGVLTAAVLLGVNILPRISTHSGRKFFHANSERAQYSKLPPFYVHKNAREVVYVVQGWPYTTNSEQALTRLITPQEKPEPWEWRQSSFDWPNGAVNGVIGLTLAFAVMAGVEFLLRRRVALRGAT